MMATTEVTNADVDPIMMDLLYKQSGKPLKDRDQTVAAMRALQASHKRPPLSNVYGTGLSVLSDIPESARKNSIVLGIDEAGRGSVIGPMLYGMAFWASTVADTKIPKDFNDSKQLSEAVREKLFDKILENKEIGFCARVLHASEISRNMLRSEPYNLNRMSHDAAIDMIRCLTDLNIAVDTCYIDTVGNPASYARLLEREFPGIQFVVESKADDKYAPCSAASIVAKVTRDRMMSSWRFSEPALADTASTEFGSGYPSDPVCKTWMKDNLSDPVFGFADAVRFSWGPAKKQLASASSTAVNVVFAADEEDGDDDEENKHKVLLGKKRQQEQMSSFLSGGKMNKEKRLPYFERKRLEVVTKL